MKTKTNLEMTWINSLHQSQGVFLKEGLKIFQNDEKRLSKMKETILHIKIF